MDALLIPREGRVIGGTRLLVIDRRNSVRPVGHRRRYSVVFLIVAGIVVSGCGGSSSSSTVSTSKSTVSTSKSTISTSTAARRTVKQSTPLSQRHRPAVYQMTINAPLAGSHISISGATNLPDGARVLIGAWRAFRQLHGDVRVASFGAVGGVGVATTVVHAGHFNGTIPVIEDTLTAGLDPSTDPEGPVAAVDPDATACARFMTGRDVATTGPWNQPDPAVRAEVGSYGEHLRGNPHAHVFGSLTKYPSQYLEASTRTPVPTSTILEKIGSVQSQAPAIEPLAGFCAF